MVKTVYTVILLTVLAQTAFAGFSHVRNYRDPVDGSSLNGWYGGLNDLKSDLDPNKNYVVAIIHNPANAFLFQDIYWFRNTVLAAKEQLTNNSHGQLGHFQVAWSCRVPGESQKYEGMTGQSGERNYQGVRMLTKLGYGMSIFFANFTDGYLQSSDASGRRVHPRASANGFQWIAVEISGQDCKNGLAYMNEYIRRGSYQNFSFAKDPSRFEGGGCTSFAAETLLRFGAFRESFIKAWQTNFSIPYYFLANPLKLPENTLLAKFLFEPKFVDNTTNFLEIGFLPVLAPRSSNVDIKIYDPELVTYSVNTIMRRAYSEAPSQFPSYYRPKNRVAYGLKGANGDYSKGSSRSGITINRSTHPAFNSLYNYVVHPNLRLPNFRYSEMAGEPGIILSKKVW